MAGAHGKRQKPVSYISHPYEDELTAVKAESLFFFRLRRVTRKFHVLAVENYDRSVQKKCAARAKLFFFFANKIYRFFVFFTVLATVSLFRIFVCVNYKYMNESFAFSPG